MFLRKKEFNSNVHQKNTERNVTYDSKIWEKYKKCKNILLVDDSVDTGYTIKLCKDEIQKFFSNSVIKVVALNYFEKSKSIIETDYSVYVDTMLNGPWSSDSKYYNEFIEKYKKWLEDYKLEK